MKFDTKLIGGAFLLTLSACGGSNGSDSNSSNNNGSDVVISRGIIDIELPSDADLAIFPLEIREVFDGLAYVNENETIEIPNGEVSYDGKFAAFLEDPELIMSGPAVVEVNLAVTEVTYTFTPTLLIAVDGTSPTIAGNLSGMAGTFEGAYTGSLDGGFTLNPNTPEAELYDVDGDVFGYFTSNSNTFGAIEAGVQSQTNPGNTTTLNGLFVANGP